MKEIRDSATAHGVELTIKMEAPPPELDVSGRRNEASEYSRLAPRLIYGPGHISCAHMPTEYIEEEQFYRSIDTFKNLALDLI
ncbi:hypothetical protein PQR75_23685 [Paraburkholderia fungorum]|jgi:acetylornithine deacetylase|uniref:hypothetical protein n=1 Tax=Paraburkholderia fungorum TaxID=134537 RepID=UPI0038B81845